MLAYSNAMANSNDPLRIIGGTRMAITTFNEQVWVENTLHATPALEVGSSSTLSGDTSIWGTLKVSNGSTLTGDTTITGTASVDY